MRQYHQAQFWTDVQSLPVHVVRPDHPIEKLRGLRFFESLDGTVLAEPSRPLFVACFYFESLIDQGLHQFFADAHAVFQAARPLPKFGRLGLGSHIRHPNAFLAMATDHWPMARDGLVQRMTEGVDYFRAWADDFFARERVRTSATDLFRAIRDRDDGDLGVVVWRRLRSV